MNLAKVLAMILNQCFRPFFMLPVEGSSQTGLVRHLSNHIFRSPYFRKHINYEGDLFSKIFKI